jgi:predicted permease
MRRDLEEELRIHFEMRIAELRSRGMNEGDAQAEANRRFGDADEFHDYAESFVARRARRLGVREGLAEWMQDVRFAARQFSKAPAFTTVAILTLALGIGANTAIFTVVHHLLLAPLPYPNGNRIVMPMQEDAHGFRRPVDRALVNAWAARGRSIDAIAGADLGSLPVQPDGTPDTISYAEITSNFLAVLGARPVLGRTFTPAEERPGADPVAMIGYGWWQRANGGSAAVIGTRVRVDAKWYSIIGVMPPGLTIPMSGERAPDFWVPATLDGANSGRGNAKAFATLRPSVTADAATQELATIAAAVPVDGPPRGRLRAMRARDFLDAGEARTIQVLFFAVGALLLIACANVANLLLARAWTRRREFAVRAALGAGRARLARQVLTESLMLSLAGGLLGVAVAWGVLRIIIALRPSSLDDLAGVHLAPAVLLWSLGVSIATGMLFGCAPAIFALGRIGDVGDTIRGEATASSRGLMSGRVRSSLIVLEIAMSVVLLIGAGLLVRSFVALAHTPLGFEPRGLVMVNTLVGSEPRGDETPPIRAAALDRLRALPGVVSAAAGVMPGVAFNRTDIETDDDGRVARTRAGTAFMGPDYLRVTRIAIVEGRFPDSAASTAEWKAGHDMGLSAEVLVNRALAARLAPARSAIGLRLRAAAGPRSKRVAPWVTVVGVVDDVHMPGVRDEARLFQVYSLTPPNFPLLTFVARTAGPGVDRAEELQKAVVSVDRKIVAQDVIAGEPYLRDSLAPTRFAMALLTAFAVVGFVLSIVGLYSVVSYAVGQRTREIGIRMALGAEPAQVVRLVVAGGARLAVVGVVVGAIVGAGSTKLLLAKLLYGVTPSDPSTVGGTMALVIAIALVASYLPARRAQRIDPTDALRAE